MAFRNAIILIFYRNAIISFFYRNGNGYLFLFKAIILIYGDSSMSSLTFHTLEIKKQDFKEKKSILHLTRENFKRFETKRREQNLGKTNGFSLQIQYFIPKLRIIYLI